MLVTSRAIPDPDGGVAGWVGTLADVTAAYLTNARARADLQDASDRSHESAVHDALVEDGVPAAKIQMGAFGDSQLKSNRSVDVLIKTI